MIVKINELVTTRDGNVLIIKKELNLGFEVYKLYKTDSLNETSVIAESFSPMVVTKRLQDELRGA